MIWKNRRIWLAAATMLLASMASTAQAGGVRVGVSIGVPLYGRPCYGPRYCHPYYVQPAVVFAPSVAVVQPAPVYVAPATVAVPAVQATPVIVRSQSEITPVGSKEEDIQRYQQQLQNPEPRERAEAVVQLGRLRAPGSLASLTAALNNDRSPLVREAAARGLGLIGSADSLDALQRAAQSDEDRQVRSSASYAADVIRTNLAHR